MALVLQLSDTHLTARPAPDGGPDAALDRALAALPPVRPDLVVLTGDLADDGSADGCERLRRKVAARFDVPMLALAGNHDRPGAVREVFGASRAVSVGGWNVVPVDTFVDGAEWGRVDPRPVADELDSLGARPTMLLLHHPPISPSTGRVFALEGAAELLELCRRRPHVRLAATGHLHQSFERRDGELLVVGAPSTWFALEHDGGDYRRDPDGITGSRLWTLLPDGHYRWELVPRT